MFNFAKSTHVDLIIRYDNRMKRSTLSDIAEKTGLSITTISRVLNGKSEQFRISERTQGIVREAVKELDYRPNVVAQTLRNNASRTLGLLVPSIENPFFASIASVVIREASNYSYPVMVIDTRESAEEEQRALDTFQQRNVDGILMVPCGNGADRLVALSREKPLVLIDRYFENVDIPYVCTDNFRGAYEATRRLIEAGHRKIMCIQGVPASITSRRRVEGYLEALREAGLEEEAMICGNNFSTGNGYVETQLALNSGREFTAIFALSSTNLLGALGALKDYGVKVPEEVSLISFDDNVYLNYLNPAVSCVSQPVEHIGIAAVKILMDRILGNPAENTTVEILPRLINRESVVRPHVEEC